jgi:Domain of unknown function (DUF6089)
MKDIKILILLLFSLCYNALQAQGLSIGLSRGTSIYQGDVSEPSLLRLKDFNAAYGGFVKFQFNNKISIRANYMKGALSGRDKNYTKIPWRINRGFQFKSPITEITGKFEWNFLNLDFSGKRQRIKPNFSIYVLGSVGYLKTNPDVDFNEPNAIYERIEIDKFANYNRSHMTVGIGGGIKWHITTQQTISFEGANNSPFTDYLDGISNSAQSKFSDWYFIGLISLSHQFSLKNNGIGKRNASVSCPRFK